MHMPCTTHAPTHARPSLPVNPSPILTPPNLYPIELHDAPALLKGLVGNRLQDCVKNRFATNISKSGFLLLDLILNRNKPAVSKKEPNRFKF